MRRSPRPDRSTIRSAIAVGLRSRAYAELIAGDNAAAVASASELMRDLLQRGALSNGRLLLDVTAAIAHRLGHDAWEQVLATARSLPDHDPGERPVRVDPVADHISAAGAPPRRDRHSRGTCSPR